jgi:hypothetical protein
VRWANGTVGDCKSMICRPFSARAPDCYESGRSYLTGQSDGLRFRSGRLETRHGAVGDCKSMICHPFSARAPDCYESGRSYFTGQSDGLRFRSGRLETQPRCGGRLQVYDLSPLFVSRDEIKFNNNFVKCKPTRITLSKRML